MTRREQDDCAKEIVRHLARYPKAADTAEGIQRWWLGGSAREASRELLEAALDDLVAQGRLVRTPLPDGTVIYAKAPGKD